MPKTPAENSWHLGDCIISTTERNYNASVQNKHGKPSALYPQRTICPKVGGRWTVRRVGRMPQEQDEVGKAGCGKVGRSG